ncbi:uncharacterized protein LOC134271721 isoform X2 [Saccostrea cucullata]
MINIVILVLTLVTLFVIFLVCCLLWYCCRSKRLPKRKDQLKNREDICNQYEQTGYVSKTENSGYLYIDSVQTNAEDKDVNMENMLVPFTNNKPRNKIDLEQKKMLVTKTTVTTVTKVVDLPTDFSPESGSIPVDYSKFTYLVPVKSDSKSF